MSEKLDNLWDHPDAANVLEGVSTIFTSLGRALICLSPDFRVVHTSTGLDDLAGEGARGAILGKSAEEILGTRLFGDEGILRRALEAGEMREGWGARFQTGDSHCCDVSVTVAPLALHSSICDPRVAYLAVLRPYHAAKSETPQKPTIFCNLIARSASMLHIFSLIEHLRQSDATILVTGESGTGKELVAQAFHRYSPHAAGPFVAVNCGALAGELLESELFGHVRGAFTGAVRDRVGRFELAAGGTLFLDEIGDLSLALQVKLLRVLQERTFERVGESRSRATDARIIAATHHDLRRAVAEGRFREDLYYRLRVVPIELPALRTRREDIEPLAEHLLERITTRQGRRMSLSPGALRALLRYEWPGNVRELENSLEFAVAVCQAQVIHENNLPPEIGDAASAPAAATGTDLQGAEALGEPSANGERERLVEALDAHHWRRADAARALGMSRTTLWRKMREFSLID